MSAVIDVVACFQDIDLAALRRRAGVKWSKYPAEILPAWIADMDFPLAPCIADALHASIANGDVGYPGPDRAVTDAFRQRALQKWAWQIPHDRIRLMPDVVESIEMLLNIFTAPGDGVVINTPIYPPFLRSTASLHRRVIENPLRHDGSLDIDHLADVFASERAKVVLLCNPHNPTGHVFRRAELQAVGELALRYDALIISDEIHAELTYPGHVHVPIAALSDDIAAHTISVTSASKPFNIAGLRCAQIISGSADLAARVSPPGVPTDDPVSTLGHVATLAAWTRQGDEWLAACLAQLEANLRRVSSWAAIHNIGFRLPEATYLAWLDFRPLGLGPNPADWLLHHAHVAVSPGPDFGRLGHGHARLNVATSPAILDQILGCMSDALAAR